MGVIFMPNTIDSVVVFDQPTIEPVHGAVPSEKLLEGEPKSTLWNYYTDASEQYRVGVWESTAGKWHAFAGRNEFCYIISGVVRLIDAFGNAKTFTAGDSFVIPPEFDGMWEVVEDAKKFYAIYQPEEA